ncbi:MAG TPA: hypothetical protein VEU08_21920 [Vicinamibacterales bacterium]|nr:hypothetical protein [Vicinamibacterales bacterium]
MRVRALAGVTGVSRRGSVAIADPLTQTRDQLLELGDSRERAQRPLRRRAIDLAPIRRDQQVLSRRLALTHALGEGREDFETVLRSRQLPYERMLRVLDPAADFTFLSACQQPMPSDLAQICAYGIEVGARDPGGGLDGFVLMRPLRPFLPVAALGAPLVELAEITPKFLGGRQLIAIPPQWPA